MASVKKAQVGAKMKAKKDSVPSEMFPGKMIPKSKSNYENESKIATGKKDVPKKKMKAGGALKPVADDQKGLSKLPTAVRNKMGYQKTGGMTKKAMFGIDMKPDAMMKMGGKASKKAMSGTKMMKGGGKCKYGC